MNQELETYFDNYFAMFRSECWKQLISDLRGNVENINSVELTEDVNNLYFRKGQLAILGTLFNLETQIDSSQQQALESKEDEDVEQDEII